MDQIEQILVQLVNKLVENEPLHLLFEVLRVPMIQHTLCF